jgi:hypothetical protein
MTFHHDENAAQTAVLQGKPATKRNALTNIGNVAKKPLTGKVRQYFLVHNSNPISPIFGGPPRSFRHPIGDRHCNARTTLCFLPVGVTMLPKTRLISLWNSGVANILAGFRGSGEPFRFLVGSYCNNESAAVGQGPQRAQRASFIYPPYTHPSHCHGYFRTNSSKQRASKRAISMSAQRALWQRLRWSKSLHQWTSKRPRSSRCVSPHFRPSLFARL